MVLIVVELKNVSASCSCIFVFCFSSHGPEKAIGCYDASVQVCLVVNDEENFTKGLSLY